MRCPVALSLLLLACDGTLPPPTPAAQTVRLLTGAITLVGRSGTTCSSGVAKPGLNADVWCAFARAAGDATELWVLNVSRATTSKVACDGTSAQCLRLTGNLWTGTPLFSASHPGIHGFEGDTLFLYADAQVSSPDDAYKGPIKAWRPGWTAARTLTSPAGYVCHGHPWAAGAYCVDAVTELPHNYQFELRAGALTGTWTGPLASAGQINALGSQGQLMWAAAFSPDGKTFAFSSPASGEDTEVLKVAATTDGGIGTPAMGVSGAGQWRISPDGKKLYYLAGYNYADGEPSGALTMVDFPPTGTAGTLLQDHVGNYLPLGGFSEGDRGLAFLRDVTKGNGTFRLLRDRAQPALATTLGDQVNEFLVSPDLRYTYLSQPDTPTGPVALLVGNDGKGACPLNTRDGVGLYSVAFAPDGNTVFWAQDADNGFDIEGWYAGTDGCAQKRLFSGTLAYLSSVRAGLLYAESDPSNQTMTLKLAPLSDGTLQEAAVIHEAIDLSLARGGTSYAVFTVSAGDEPGLYAYGPLP